MDNAKDAQLADGKKKPLTEKRKKKRTTETSEPHLEMTPMIDCVFQLLIFFMLTGKFVGTEGKLAAFLPRDKGTLNINIPEPKMPIRILLRWNPTINRCKVYVGQVLCNYDEEGISRALARVRQIKQTGSDKAEIDAGGDVPMHWIVQSLNMLIQANLQEINFTGAMNPLEGNR
jgi:biopolymer transport protein ExbD